MVCHPSPWKLGVPLSISRKTNHAKIAIGPATRTGVSELGELLLDLIVSGVDPTRSPEAALVPQVFQLRLPAQTGDGYQEWEPRVLPAVSQPIPVLLDRSDSRVGQADDPRSPPSEADLADQHRDADQDPDPDHHCDRVALA